MTDVSNNDFETFNQTALKDALLLAGLLAAELKGGCRLHALSIASTCLHAIRSGNSEGHLYALRNVAHAASRLAKDRIENRLKTRAYEIKDLCLSALILDRHAAANEIGPDNSISLEIQIRPATKLHTYLSRLQPDARLLVRRQLGIAIPPVPMSERLSPEQVETLRNFQATRSIAA